MTDVVGILLMTYGAPRSDDDLPAYITSIRGGRPATPELLAEFARRYAAIGGSPLVRITEAQAAALEKRLNAEAGAERARFRVVAGMRHSRPFIRDRIGELAAAGARSVVAICMSPQWSDLIMGGYARAVEEAVPLLGPEAHVTVVREWHREVAFVGAMAERLTEALAALGPEAERTPVLLTAHSLPKSVFEREPEYVAQLRETAELVAARAELPRERWQWAYQSAGHTAEEWLRPDLKELFPALAAAGHRRVLVAPIQFLADHLEVLYDLDVAAATEARAAGLEYRRIAMPNMQPAFIGALAAVVRRELARDAVPV